MSTEMKAWQKGYDLKFLLELEKFYTTYNTFADSPFNSVKKNTIASCLHENTMNVVKKDDMPIVMFDTRMVKSRSTITMYQQIALGTKEPGDRVISKLAWKQGYADTAADILTGYTEPTWLYVWAEDPNANHVAQKAGFKWVGTKITTFAELYAIYFKDATRENALDHTPRTHPARHRAEDLCLERTKLGEEDILPHIQELASQIQNLNLDFTNHYSNYNKNKSWSALSLRGYTPDIAFITKPEEMNKKWKAEHADVNFFLQDTPLRAMLPAAEKLVNMLPGTPQRIRIMKLTAGGGELTRHTDQVDPDCGVQDGKLMRFHFPIITNDKVKFTMWGVDGAADTANMKVGECWYLDTRKPHRAENQGENDRLHLVIDVEANDDVRRLVLP